MYVVVVVVVESLNHTSPHPFKKLIPHEIFSLYKILNCFIKAGCHSRNYLAASSSQFMSHKYRSIYPYRKFGRFCV